MIVSGNARATSHGSDPIPTWMLTAVRLHEIITILLAVVAAYIFVYKPCAKR